MNSPFPESFNEFSYELFLNSNYRPAEEIISWNVEPSVLYMVSDNCTSPACTLIYCTVSSLCL